jgi:hypothetical protein
VARTSPDRRNNPTQGLKAFAGENRGMVPKRCRVTDDFHCSPPWHGASKHRDGSPFRETAPTLSQYDAEDAFRSGKALRDPPPGWAPPDVSHLREAYLAAG